MRDFTLNPPQTVVIETHSYSHDSNGNPTAHYLVMWGNDKTGEDYQGGQYATKRRAQTGYADTSEDALLFIESQFPRTVWEPVEGTKDGSRADGKTSQVFKRNPDKEPVPVIFRTVRSGIFAGTVDAWFPTLSGTGRADDCTIYSHVGQHSTGTKDFYRESRAATSQEIAPLKKELESLGYVLELTKRWNQHFDLIRFETEKRN